MSPASAAFLAGFEPGDLLLTWTFEPVDQVKGDSRTGRLDTPFDLREVLLELLPRGELTFQGWRNGRTLSWILPFKGSLDFGLKPRPAMELDRWESFRRALREIHEAEPGKDPPAAISAPETTASESPRLVAWYRLRLAEALASAGYIDAADRNLAEAAEILLRASDTSARGAVLQTWADQLFEREESARAWELLKEALAVQRQHEGAELSVAYLLGLQAYYWDREGELQAAESAELERLALLERLLPEGQEIAHTLDFLGYLALWRGNVEAAEERLARAEAIQRRLGETETLLFGGTLTKKSFLAQERGDLEGAESLQRQVLAINERLTPGSLDHAGSLMNLASTLILRGELASAEDLLRRSVELFDTPDAEPWVSAGPYNNLGMLALGRGDLAAAQTYFELAFDRRKRGPESVELAGAYGNLAEVARLQKRFADARTLEASALAITERLDLERTTRLQALARIEGESGDLAKAEALLRQVEARLRETEPASLEADTTKRDLGQVVARAGRFSEAEALYLEVLASLQRKGLKGTRGEAEILNLLGDAQRRLGDLSTAEASFCAATRALDLQRSRLGGDPGSRSWFEAGVQSYFFDCLSALADRGRSADAFHALERGKTRAFLQLLAERDLRLAELPVELKTERARLNVEYDRVLSQLGSGKADETTSLRARLEDLKAARETLLARLKEESPLVAGFESPAPLDLAAARRVLDPGTLLLAYAVGSEQAYLFVVRPVGVRGPDLDVHRLPVGRSALEKEIEAFRRLLTDPSSDPVHLDDRASRLYDLLVRPAERRLARSKRILISADGPLHGLPWAALRRHGRYLTQRWPIHSIGSVTLYEEILRDRRPVSDPGAWKVVAFGDPSYPPASAATEALADSEVRSVLRRGVHLEPLPATRAEVQELAKLFPGAEIYLGEEATEERAKQASRHADLLHFASHGLLDERFPLDSALALAIPAQPREGQDNGLLQAWEIFESVRLDAGLVTLSACDTGLGKEMGGDGILGLTRAFQFAGARSVLASLWNVSDASTAALMRAFYTYLRQGKSKAEALRAAQLDLLRSKKAELSHPYHWAGFSLYGDWK